MHNGGAPINRYQVQRANAATGPWSGVVKLAATTLVWTDTGLNNGTRYYYRVRAHNSVGWGAPSSVVSAVPRTVPSAPLSPAATWGDGSATVSWSVPASDGGAAINEYQLQYSSDGLTWAQVTTSGAQTQVTVNGLQNGTQFHFRVRAHNVAGWGPASTEVLATPGLPLPPTGVTGEPTATGAEFSWTASATVSPALQGYEVQWSNDGELWHVDYNSPNVTSYPFTGTIGATYQFRVRAYNSAGQSVWSNTASSIAGQAPGTVGTVSVTYYGSPLFANSVGWSVPASGSPPQGYYVDRMVTEGTYQRVATVPASDFPSYYDQGVTHFTYYSYVITPYNQVGNGPPSEGHITTP